MCVNGVQNYYFFCRLINNIQELGAFLSPKCEMIEARNRKLLFGHREGADFLLKALREWRVYTISQKHKLQKAAVAGRVFPNPPNAAKH